jgi:hypothetical protein
LRERSPLAARRFATVSSTVVGALHDRDEIVGAG